MTVKPDIIVCNTLVMKFGNKTFVSLSDIVTGKKVSLHDTCDVIPDAILTANINSIITRYNDCGRFATSVACLGQFEEYDDQIVVNVDKEPVFCINDLKFVACSIEVHDDCQEIVLKDKLSGRPVIFDNIPVGIGDIQKDLWTSIRCSPIGPFSEYDSVTMVVGGALGEYTSDSIHINVGGGSAFMLGGIDAIYHKIYDQIFPR